MMNLCPRRKATFQCKKGDMPKARTHVAGEDRAAGIHEERWPELEHPLVVGVAEDDDLGGVSGEEVRAEVAQLALGIGEVECAGAVRPFELVNERDRMPFEFEDMVVSDAGIAFQSLVVVSKCRVHGRESFELVENAREDDVAGVEDEIDASERGEDFGPEIPWPALADVGVRDESDAHDRESTGSGGVKHGQRDLWACGRRIVWLVRRPLVSTRG